MVVVRFVLKYSGNVAASNVIYCLYFVLENRTFKLESLTVISVFNIFSFSLKLTGTY